MPDQTKQKRGLAIVANCITPYGINLYRCIAAGIPELKLHLLVSHWAAEFEWQVRIPPEIRVTHFGSVGESPLDNPLRRPLHDWRKGGRFIRYIHDNDIRAVIMIGYRTISLMRLMNYCHAAHVPFFVFSDSNIRDERKFSPLAKFTKRRIYAWWMKRVSGVLSMGSLGDQFFVKYGADPGRLYRVPCWPDFDSFTHRDEVALQRFQRKFGLDRRRRFLLFSGRLVADKRVDLLIDAFSMIADDRPDWDLLIAGDGVLRDELQRRVPDRLRHRVVWTGFLDREEPALAYHSADVLVLPSDREPWALVVQEAMAAGLPVVSSDVSGAAFEIVEDRRSGRIFPRGDVEQLKQALLDITANDALVNYKRESAAALARWRNKVNPVSEIRRALVDVGVLHPVPQLISELSISGPSVSH